MVLSCSRLFTSLLGATAILAMLGCGGSSSSDSNETWYETNAVASAQLNGDGRLDVICVDATYGRGAPHPGFISTRLQGSTAGTYLDPLRTDTNPDPVAVAVGDINGDGRPDIVLANHQATGGPWINNYVTACYQSASTAGTFPAQSKLYVGARNPVDVATADLDGDGRLDVIVAAEGGSDLLVFFQTALGVFSAPTSLAVGSTPTSVTTGNLLGSGTDIVAATSVGVSVLLHAGTPGTFQTAVNYANPLYPVAVKVADINGDGHPDITTANWDGVYDGLSILLQNGGTGTFQAPVYYDTGDYYPASITVGVIGSDTLPSVLVANYGAPGYSGSVAVLRPDAAHPGQLLTAEMYRGYYGPSSITLGDLDGDGRLDMIVADGSTLVRYQDPANPGYFLAPFTLRN